MTGCGLPGSDGMGLELLAYHPPGRAMPPGGDGRRLDATGSRSGCPGLAGPRMLRDPDGHVCVLVSPRAGDRTRARPRGR